MCWYEGGGIGGIASGGALGMPLVTLGVAGAAGGDSCNAADYAKPDVEIADLTQPGVADALVKSIQSHKPETNTPTAPALQGAIDHAKAWAQQNPSHVVIALLATDVVVGIVASRRTGDRGDA